VGTVFQITPSGTLTTLYSFCSQSKCTDGAYPLAPLVQGTNGNFYGTTYFGGNSFASKGAGTVFQINAAGTLTTLYSFCSLGGNSCTDGASPAAGLLQATDGNFYGTTSSYGANGGGTVFQITPSGTLTTLYNFCSQFACEDGIIPLGALIQAMDGDLYGTTSGGGTNRENEGTIFKITPTGSLTTLYSFDLTDGAYPAAGLLQATDGNFYGTTEFGGFIDDCVIVQNKKTKHVPCGTVFSLSESFSLTAVPNTLTITQGNSGTSIIRVIQGIGFTGSVNLSASGLPNGVTAQFNPNPTTTTSTLTLTASGNAATGTSTVTITGTSGDLTASTTIQLTVIAAAAPAVTLTPTSLTFPKTEVGTTSKAKDVTLENSGTATLNITSITASGDFALVTSSKPCGSTLAAGKKCKIAVTFTPLQAGTLTGDVTITDNAPNSPQQVPLSGTGK